MVVSAVASRFGSKEPETLSVEQCISKGVFGSEENVFEEFRQEAAKIPARENATIAAANEQLKNKIPVLNFNFMEWMQKTNVALSWLDGQEEEQRKHAEWYKDVPLVVVPGQEEAYLNDLAKKNGAATARLQQEQMRPEAEQEEKKEEEGRQNVIPGGETAWGEPTEQANTNGWDSLFGTLGLNGMGDTFGNLGYVMAMLPDVLLGAFTGKSPSLRFGDNLLPIASIVAGIFVRNPLLKMLLVGLGGANLLNKAGHEALQGRTDGKVNITCGNDVQYRRYPDEPLNPRIANPVLQGGMLIATIDRVPCTIQLPTAVAEAYRTGALPLNTLANAVLAKSDQLRQAAAQNYDNGQQEIVMRTRGIQ